MKQKMTCLARAGNRCDPTAAPYAGSLINPARASKPNPFELDLSRSRRVRTSGLADVEFIVRLANVDKFFRIENGMSHFLPDRGLVQGRVGIKSGQSGDLVERLPPPVRLVVEWWAAIGCMKD